MKRILLIDESKKVQDEIGHAIGNRFDLSIANNLQEARVLLGRDLFDLIVLEAILPDGDGYHFCAELRKKEMTSEIPVIFLAESASVPDKVKAFSMGADDYMVKPLEPLELGARMDARLKKLSSLKDQNSFIQKGDLILRVPFQKASLRDAAGEKDLKLTPTEFRLLYFFIQNDESVLSRAQLLSIIWSEDVHVLTRTIDKHISTLKKKLGSRAGYIQSVHSRGYRFSTTLRSPSRESGVSPEVLAGAQ